MYSSLVVVSCCSYARKAKRVDVRRLKGDLWRKINTEFQSDAAAAGAATAVMNVDDDGGDPEAEGDADMEQVCVKKLT